MEAPPEAPTEHNVDQLHYQPRIFRVKDFLTDEECEHLINTAKDRLRPCNEISAGVNRTGWGLFFREGEENHKTVRKILDRMKQYVPVTSESEVMQVMRYQDGEETSAHFDYFNPLTPNGAMKIGIYGQRIATCLMYLNEVEEGGATIFPELNLTVAPRKGDALVFYNCKPNGEVDPLSMHQGEKVHKGPKWIAIKLVNKKYPPVEQNSQDT
jgi:prolyl 4-hydroxylase